jgi:hypothetical protein
MGQGRHYSPAQITDCLREGPPAAMAELELHARACQSCAYLLILVRRVSGEPTGEQSEVLVDRLCR